MGQKAFGRSYRSFLGLGIMMESATLSWDGHILLSRMPLKMLAKVVSSGKSLKTSFKCHHVRWSPPGVDMLEVRARLSMISATEMGGQDHSGKLGSSSIMSQLISPEAAVLLKCPCMWSKSLSGSVILLLRGSWMVAKDRGCLSLVHLTPCQGQLDDVIILTFSSKKALRACQTILR